MSEEPERIWAQCSAHQNWDDLNASRYKVEWWHEYRRADLPPTLSAAMELPEVPTDAQLHYACLSYRHDYGLMDLVSREKLQWECREWWRCISRAAIKEPKP